MIRPIQIVLILVVLVASAGAAVALEADEVFVVANAALKDSRDLAKYYAEQRDIPDKNILLVKTTGNYEIARDAYNEELLAPIREALVKRKLMGRVKCIVLMWGVPVRVSGQDAPGELDKTYRNARTRAHYRLATAQIMMATVGKRFPDPDTTSLTPLSKLFDPVTKKLTKLPKPDALLKDLKRVIEYKAKDLRLESNKKKRGIMARQLMALQLDVFGLEGLIEFIKDYDPDGAPDADKLKSQLDTARKKLNSLGKVTSEKEAQVQIALTEIISGAWGAYALADQYAADRPNPMTGPQKDAAVDSELALLWHRSYPLKKSVPNPLHWRIEPRLRGKRVPPTLMAARIDGPSASDAKRMIKDSIAAEKEGLKGKIYIDAGGKHPAYDKHLTDLYAMLKKHEVELTAVLDSERSVFQRGKCPQAALYVGWYSLQKYVPAFQWNPGSVGWHIASFEAKNLRNPKSQEWCPQMIQNGIAATIGPVNEPYLGAFPVPKEFFGLLLTGRYTLAECYWRTVPQASWRMTLIGDPLYNPFKTNPQLKKSDLPKGLAP